MFVFYRNKSRVTVMHYDTVAFSLQVKFIKGYREIQMVNPINIFQTQNQKCLWGKEQRLRTISAVQRYFCRRVFLNPYPLHARNILGNSGFDNGNWYFNNGNDPTLLWYSDGSMIDNGDIWRKSSVSVYLTKKRPKPQGHRYLKNVTILDKLLTSQMRQSWF